MTIYTYFNQSQECRPVEWDVIGWKKCIWSTFRLSIVHWCYRRNVDGLGFSLRVGFGQTGPVWEIEAILPKTGMIPLSSVLTILSRLPFRLCMTKPIVFLWHTIFEKLSYKPLYTLSYYRITVSFNWKFFSTAFIFETSLIYYGVSKSYRIISYRVVLYCIVSYHIISYRIVSYRIVSYHIKLYRIISYRMYRIVLCHNIQSCLKMNFTSKVEVQCI